MTLREIMPWWVGWLGPALFAALVVTWLLIVPGMALWRVRRRLHSGQHWSERAAIATEGRTAIAAGIVMWPIVSIGLVQLVNGSFSRLPDWALILAASAAALLFSLAIGWRFVKRDLQQPLPGFTEYLWLVARKWWPAAALVGLAAAAPSRLSSPWMIPWTIAAVGGLFGLRYLADLYVATGVARPAGPRVVAAVERAAIRSGTDAPRVFELDSHAGNAVALPVRNLIIVTERLIDELDDAELEAILLHEIAHLNERRSVTRRRMLGNLLLLPVLAIKPLVGSGIIYLALAVLVVAVFQRMLTMMTADEETRADHAAVDLSHESHNFGTALLKLHRAALIPVFIKRDPHGPLHERLLRAGVEPDFEPVESSPKNRTFFVAAAAAILPIILVFLIPLLTLDVWDGDRGSHTAIAMGWRSEEVLGYTGYLRADSGDFAEAAVYLAEATERGDDEWLDELAWALARLGRCDEAREAHFAILNGGGDADDAWYAERWVADCYERGGG